MSDTGKPIPDRIGWLHDVSPLLAAYCVPEACFLARAQPGFGPPGRLQPRFPDAAADAGRPGAARRREPGARGRGAPDRPPARHRAPGSG